MYKFVASFNVGSIKKTNIEKELFNEVFGRILLT